MISDAQIEALKPFTQGRVVHDLGAGRLHHTCLLATDLEAGQVIAMDKVMPPDLPSQENVTFVQEEFIEHSISPTAVAFVSWPINRNVHLEFLLAKVNTVVYLGKNTDGMACGDPILWSHLTMRKVQLHVPHRQNDLIVYGEFCGDRPLLPEELGAIDQSRIYKWHEVHNV